MLTSPFLDEEFWRVIFQIHSNKSTGPNGLNPTFFQHFLPLVGKEVVHSCREWLIKGEFPSFLNETIIVLIPKVESPSNMKDLSLYRYVMCYLK